MFFTPLTRAIVSNNPAAVKRLLEEGADPDERDPSGEPPLAYAALLDDRTEIIRLLVEHGADIKTKDQAGMTALDWAKQNNNAEAMQILKDAPRHRAQATIQKDKRQALIEAIDALRAGTDLPSAGCLGNLVGVKYWLANGADVNEKGKLDKTALHWAAYNGNEKIAQLLIDNGADTNLRDAHGHTPLYWAEYHRHSEIVGMLKDAPKRQKQLAEERQKKETKGKLLHDSIRSGDCDKVRRIFDDAFWNKEKIHIFIEHLIVPLERQDKPMLRLLIAHQPDISGRAIALLPPEQQTLLRRCGMEDIPLPLSPEAPPEKKEKVDRLPQEWLEILDQFHTRGSPKAVIAGEGLMDHFNKRAVRKIYFYVEDQGSNRKNKKLLKKIFDLPISREFVGTGGRKTNPIEFEGLAWKPATGCLYNQIQENSRMSHYPESPTKTWTILQTERNMECNIVFVDGYLKKEAPSFADGLLQAFDFSLCQIATDGKKIITSKEYEEDVPKKYLRLVGKNQDSWQHVEELVRKYPEWKHCENTKKLRKREIFPL